LHDELSEDGFTVLGVALDDSVDDVRPWVEGISFPVLIDPNHVLTELYAISNVPTVIWIDENDRIVRPNGVAFGTDTFKEFTGVEAAPHKDSVRQWVREGRQPMPADEARTAVGDLSADEIAARLHFRIATTARRQGHEEVAKGHFQRAAELAPYDWTIRRAALPLTGGDPFGQEFFDMYEEWQQAGSPYHGLAATRSS
jgi:hypothetical protein